MLVTLLATALAPPLAIAACASTPVEPYVEPEGGTVLGPVDAGDAATSFDGAPDAVPPCTGGRLCKVVSPLTFGSVTSLVGRSKDDIWASGSRGVLMHWNGQLWNIESKEEARRPSRACF